MARKKKRSVPKPRRARVIALAVRTAYAAPEPVVSLSREGLAHLATVTAVCVVLALGTYASRSLLRFRPWEPGEGVPIIRLFERGQELQVASAAEPAGPVDPEGVDVESPQIALDPVLLAAATEDDGEDVDEVRDAGEGDAGAEAPLITMAEVSGLPLEIEDTEGAMDAFYRSLERTARGEAVITRVAHFGDSTIAFDGITQTVRERLQRRFGDAGSGFVLATHGTLPYGHHHVRTQAEGDWRLLDITHQSLSDGRYGIGGGQARGEVGASAWFETALDRSPVGTSATRFQVLYQRFDRGGRFDWRVDGGAWTSVDTRLGNDAPIDETLDPGPSTDAVDDAVLDVDVPAGPHRLSIRAMGHGDSRIYGVVVENGDRGVVYDSLGMVGARAQRMLGFDATHLAGQLAARHSDLVIIAFGGNDADDEREQAEFESTFRHVARLIRRARPGASCLLMAPLDQAERDERGAITTLPTIPLLVEGMRSAAHREGCAFFDTWTAMGGEGAMGRWFRQEPRLSGGDFRHATPAGYRVIGEMLYRALLMGFRRYEHDHETP